MIAPRHRYALFIASSLIALLGLGAGCSDSSSCSTDDDCFSGEVCTTGTCGLPGVGGDDAGSLDSGIDASDAGPGDVGTVSPDMGTETGDAMMDAEDAEEDASTTGPTCVVDPFETDPCPPDDNDRFAEVLESPGGCQPDGFVALDFTKTFRKCAIESTDLYTQTFTQCEQQLLARVTLTPTVECDPELLDLEMRMGTLRCSTQDESPDISCGWENGSYVANLVVPASRSLSILNIEVDTGERTDLDFEYDLRVELPNPGL